MKKRIVLTRMQIVYKWETGDVWRVYSPKGKTRRNSLIKRVGGFFVSLGASILFGRKGWTSYKNRVEWQDES